MRFHQKNPHIWQMTAIKILNWWFELLIWNLTYGESYAFDMAGHGQSVSIGQGQTSPSPTGSLHESCWGFNNSDLHDQHLFLSHIRNLKNANHSKLLHLLRGRHCLSLLLLSHLLCSVSFSYARFFNPMRFKGILSFWMMRRKSLSSC